MNVIFLTAIVFTVALVHGQPCQNTSDNNAYNRFVRKHILKRSFSRTSLKAWQSHLMKNKLCGDPNRVRQSFVEAPERDVRQICSPAGRRVQGATVGNLCISNSAMQVYDVSVNYSLGCRVTRVTPRTHNVIVACNIVANQCRPVHYQAYNYQMPSNIPCM